MVFIFFFYLEKLSKKIKQWHFLPEKKKEQKWTCVFYVNDPRSRPLKANILWETGSQHVEIK